MSILNASYSRLKVNKNCGKQLYDLITRRKNTALSRTNKHVNSKWNVLHRYNFNRSSLNSSSNNVPRSTLNGSYQVYHHTSIPDTSNLLPANKRENANKQRLFSFPDIIPHRIDNPILFFRNVTS